MIAAMVLEKIFNGLTLTYNEYSSTLKSCTEVTKTVQFHYGDQEELSKWVRGRKGKQKYPLIWCVIEPLDGNNADTFKGLCCLYLFTGTKTEYYNDTRAKINYVNIFDKLQPIVMRLIEENNVIQLIFTDYEKMFNVYDVPNFGVSEREVDFKANFQKDTKGITIDVLDARKIEFQARFNLANAQCLI